MSCHAYTQCTVPDGYNLTHTKRIVIQLGNKNSCHCLIECSPIHINGGSHWKDKAGDALVNAVVFLCASESDGQGGRASLKECRFP